MWNQGAYVLHLSVKRSVQIRAGALKSIHLPAGQYLYVGSARRNMDARLARHRRLVEQRAGKLHWHIDYLLTHRHVHLTGHTLFAAENECAISRRIASSKGVSIPVPHFGSSDCRSGCRAHLYRLDSNRRSMGLISSTQIHKQDNSEENKNG
jgi:Uri superfamily endonuclease